MRVRKGVQQLAIALIGSVALMSSMGASGGCGSSASSGAKASVQPQAGTTAPEQPAPAKAKPTARSYRVTVKTLSKECFGSAGCNVNVRIVISLVQQAAVGQAAELSIAITGGEDGTEVQTVNIDEDGKYDPPELLISTPRSSSVIRAKITEVALD